VDATLFWSKGDGECGVGNIEVAFPLFKKDADGAPQEGKCCCLEAG